MKFILRIAQSTKYLEQKDSVTKNYPECEKYCSEIKVIKQEFKEIRSYSYETIITIDSLENLYNFCQEIKQRIVIIPTKSDEHDSYSNLDYPIIIIYNAYIE